MSPSELGLMTRMDLMLSAKFQALCQHARQTGLDDLFLRRRKVVLPPALFDNVFVDLINAVGRAPIAIARLADTAGIDEIFLRGFDDELVGIHAFDAVVADEGARDVSVAEKADGGVLIGEARRGIESIEDVSPLLGCIEGRMDNGEVAHLPGKSQVAKPLFVRFGQLLTRTVDGHLGESVEIAGRFLERGLLVVVPFHDRAFELLDDLDALMRIRVVTDDIAEADVMSAI